MLIGGNFSLYFYYCQGNLDFSGKNDEVNGSNTNIFIVFAFKTPLFWPYMVMWRKILISFISCKSTSFYPIEMGFSPEIIEFYAKNHYQVFTLSFLNFLFNGKYGHHI